MGAVDREMAKLLKMRLIVGIPASAGLTIDGKATLALVGYVQETGSPLKNIPPRPFLVPGVINAKAAIAKNLCKAATDVLSGLPASEGVKSFMAAGLIAQGDVRQKMLDGPFVPLKPATLYRRLHRKRAPRTGVKPLIDTGGLKNAVTYAVKGS